jgi:hypothetical protein
MQQLRINSQSMSFNLEIKDNKPYYYINIKYPDANVGINQDDNGRPHIVFYFKQFARKKYFGLQEQIKSYANREIYTKYIDPELEEMDIKLDYSIGRLYSHTQGRQYQSGNKKRTVLYGTVEYSVVFTFEDDYDVTATRLIDVKKSLTRAIKKYLDSLKPLSKRQYKVYSGIRLRNHYRKIKFLNVSPGLRGLGTSLPF